MDSDLLGRLLDQHAAALALYARQWCQTPEDVVQDAFLKLAGLHSLPDNPVAWLFQVVRNGAIDAGKAARRRSRHEAVAASQAESWFEADSPERPQTIDPDRAAAELKALPIEEREVIIAHIWGGLTFEQVAVVAGCSSSAAHRLYSRGLSTLRERLGVSCRKSRPIPS
ncbi:MAG: RNA polymerase sigma factor [Isosphaeraceae bacterium]